MLITAWSSTTTPHLHSFKFSPGQQKPFTPHTFVFSCLPCGFWPLASLADQKGTQEGCLGHIFSIFVIKLYGFCLRVACIAYRHHPYIESTDSLIILPGLSTTSQVTQASVLCTIQYRALKVQPYLTHVFFSAISL